MSFSKPPTHYRPERAGLITVKIKPGQENAWEVLQQQASNDSCGFDILKFTMSWAELMEIQVNDGQLIMLTMEIVTNAERNARPIVNGFMAQWALKYLHDFWYLGDELKELRPKYYK
jgi:hypothetical protein